MTQYREGLQVLKKLNISEKSAAKFDYVGELFQILGRAANKSGLIIKANLASGIYTINAFGGRDKIDFLPTEFSVEILGKQDSSEDVVKAQRLYDSLKLSLSAIGVELLGLAKDYGVEH